MITFSENENMEISGGNVCTRNFMIAKRSLYRRFTPNTFSRFAFHKGNIHPQPLNHLLADLITSRHVYHL
jgi:hypothetical protein